MKTFHTICLTQRKNGVIPSSVCQLNDSGLSLGHSAPQKRPTVPGQIRRIWKVSASFFKKHTWRSSRVRWGTKEYFAFVLFCFWFIFYLSPFSAVFCFVCFCLLLCFERGILALTGIRTRSKLIPGPASTPLAHVTPFGGRSCCLPS